MNQSEILRKIKPYKNKYQGKYQFVKIGVFGSVARGTFDQQSDIDIIVEQKKPDLFLLGSIKVDLEDYFGVKVDTIRLRDGMNIQLKKRIERDVIDV